jgi:predicted short-subunit dehydrogenase-like oxidoreductase (DUF2520 family)
MDASSSSLPVAGFGALARVAHTRPSRRYRRLYRAYRLQMHGLMRVDPVLRAHVEAALQRLAATGATHRLDGDAVACADRVLDDLARLGDIDLQREVSCLREELALARGHTLEELLADSA